jgi:hypothetical protein
VKRTQPHTLGCNYFVINFGLSASHGIVGQARGIGSFIANGCSLEQEQVIINTLRYLLPL